MVGKAIRHASNGLGGRPQQILAVVLTYFAITASYGMVFIYTAVRHPEQFEQSAAAAIFTLLLLIVAAPFFGLTSISGIISLALIFFGMQKAWRLTGRSQILVMGPYETAPAS